MNQSKDVITPEGALIRGNKMFHKMSTGLEEKWVWSGVVFEYMRNGWKDVTFHLDEYIDVGQG